MNYLKIYREDKMNETIKQQNVRSKKAAIKAIILAAFIIGAIFLVQFTPVKNYLTSEFLNSFLGKAGFWAPLIYILFYVAGELKNPSGCLKKMA